jgi:hypothetical protein
MKFAAFLLLAVALAPAWAQPGPGPGSHGGPRGWEPGARPMPPPERRMAWEERQRLREQVRSGQMTREEAREQWRRQHGMEPGQHRGRFTPEQREQLRRDIMDANKDLQRR